jgi:uncharacterized protein YyaL (SSP411 family)
MSENRLGRETSPYLLQHKDNPVHWWPWSEEALGEAKRTGKPILLSVGYAACHWCHVMAHESFEDEATAKVMNDLFVNIKVDREERPDVDAIYMGALHRLGERGGWPLTMFLDSDARPFWGGTYFPKEARYGRPAFATVLLRIAEAFATQPENVKSNAEKLIASLAREGRGASDFVISDGLVRDLTRGIAQAVDPQHGGLKGAPKFPQWSIFWLLWRGAIFFEDSEAQKAVLTTLTHIAQGGIYDHLGGGFTRYSVDELWLVPHFEKMLYDNALLIDLLTHASRESQQNVFQVRIAETVAWLKREMVTEGGGFASSLDADSEGEEGKFYVWSAAEIRDVLGKEDYVFFAKIYGVSDAGNFEGRTILNRLDHLEWLGAEDEARLAEMRAKLCERRATRVRPGLDDKVLADWNGLMIAALARASAVFGEDAWLKMCERAFGFIESEMQTADGRLWHSWRAGVTRAPGTAADYANMIWAALRLYQATGAARYLDAAKRWSAVLDAHHWDGDGGGYFISADDTSDVIVRLKPAQDDAVPNANAIQLSNLIALTSITGDGTYDDRARALLKAYSGVISSAPVAHCGLIAAWLDLERQIQVKLPLSAAGAFVEVLYSISLPGALEYVGKSNDVQLSPALASVPSGTAETAVLVCIGPACGPPVDEPEALRARLTEARSSRDASS